jgi:tetratricopeptide (TPR) repeat protein
VTSARSFADPDVHRPTGAAEFFTIANRSLRRLPKGRQSTAEKVLGQEDAVTLVSVTNLAVFYQSKRRYDAAEPLFKRAVDASGRVLGKEHLETLNRMDHLADLYGEEDRRVEAEEIYKRVLAIRVRTLRPKDSKIADSRKW